MPPRCAERAELVEDRLWAGVGELTQAREPRRRVELEAAHAAARGAGRVVAREASCEAEGRGLRPRGRMYPRAVL